MARKSVGPEGAPLTLLRPSANVVGLDGADHSTTHNLKQINGTICWETTVGDTAVRFVDTGQPQPEFPKVLLTDFLALIESPPERHALTIENLSRVGVTSRARIGDELALLIPSPLALEMLSLVVDQGRAPLELVQEFDHAAVKACACIATRHRIPLTTFLCKAGEAHRGFLASIGAGGGE
ncbi:MAG: hypothetical protein AB1918_10705 [Pseudomonadota bacterium]